MFTLTFAIGILIVAALIITIYFMVRKTADWWIPLLILEVAMFLLMIGKG